MAVSQLEGGRHELDMIVGGRSNRAWVDQLDEYSVFLPGHVLAALNVGTVEEKGNFLLASIEAVTVREA